MDRVPWVQAAASNTARYEDEMADYTGPLRVPQKKKTRSNIVQHLGVDLRQYRKPQNDPPGFKTYNNTLFTISNATTMTTPKASDKAVRTTLGTDASSFSSSTMSSSSFKGS